MGVGKQKESRRTNLLCSFAIKDLGFHSILEELEWKKNIKGQASKCALSWKIKTQWDTGMVGGVGKEHVTNPWNKFGSATQQSPDVAIYRSF